MNKNEIETRLLQEILDKLMSMERLSEAGSPQTRDHHEEWMRQHEEIVDLVGRAEHLAILTTPREIYKIMEKIEARKDVLFGIGQKKQAQENTNEHGRR